MAFFDSFTSALKEKWLQYYQANHEWLNLHMQVAAVKTPDGGRRPPSYFILGSLNGLEPKLAQLMLPFSRLNPDPDTLIEVLGLNFDPDIALGLEPESLGATSEADAGDLEAAADLAATAAVAAAATESDEFTAESDESPFGDEEVEVSEEADIASEILVSDEAEEAISLEESPEPEIADLSELEEEESILEEESIEDLGELAEEEPSEDFSLGELAEEEPSEADDEEAILAGVAGVGLEVEAAEPEMEDESDFAALDAEISEDEDMDLSAFGGEDEASEDEDMDLGAFGGDEETSEDE
ncbi:MAG: hypothetical protein J7641_13545, partial [Cyanobacteria bacterium SID2]|nr:hypothetical protein [Cyanobacteria bacterium SID2]